LFKNETLSFIFEVTRESSGVVNIPASIFTPRPFKIPTPGPVSYLSKSELISFFIVLSSFFNDNKKFHKRSSNSPISIDLFPSEPKVILVNIFSFTTKKPCCLRYSPAPAICT
tara:strand:+ start:2725 stop:3063 length:339 start_codon:yes stop_codon:yes gene_type:complete